MGHFSNSNILPFVNINSEYNFRGYDVQKQTLKRKFSPIRLRNRF